jgi:hypothetical protein
MLWELAIDLFGSAHSVLMHFKASKPGKSLFPEWRGILNDRIDENPPGNGDIRAQSTVHTSRLVQPRWVGI